MDRSTCRLAWARVALPPRFYRLHRVPRHAVHLSLDRSRALHLKKWVWLNVRQVADSCPIHPLRLMAVMAELLELAFWQISESSSHSDDCSGEQATGRTWPDIASGPQIRDRPLTATELTYRIHLRNRRRFIPRPILSIRIIVGDLEKVIKLPGLSLGSDSTSTTCKFFLYVVAVVAPGRTGS